LRSYPAGIWPSKIKIAGAVVYSCQQNWVPTPRHSRYRPETRGRTHTFEINLDAGVEESRMKHRAFMGLAVVRLLDHTNTARATNPPAGRPR